MRKTAVLLAFVLAGIASAADVSIIDEIICKANGEIITRSDYDRARAEMEASLRQQGATGTRLQQAMEEGEKDILRGKIDEILLISKGKELNVNVDAEVNKQLADIQRQAKIADPDKFAEYVRQGTGQSLEDYKNDLKNQILTNRVIRQEIASKIQFKHDDLQKYYDEHQSEFQRNERVFLREIFVGSDGKDAAAAERKAKDLSARGKKGEKFDELAQANSDSASAQQGGDIGAYEKGKLRAEIENAVWDKPKGYVTDPINVGTGFLIYKVEDHQKAGLALFDEVQGEINNKLFQPKFQPELRKYLTQLRQNAFLEIKPGYTDSGAAAGKDTTWMDVAEIKPETITKEEVAAKTRRKHLFGVVPIPGTQTQKTGVSSSR